MNTKPIDQAREVFASINRKLKNPNLTGQQRGILQNDLKKSRTILQQAYATTPTAPTSPAKIVPITKSVVVIDHDDDDDEDAQRREVSFDFYCVPSSSGAKNVTGQAWNEWITLQRKLWKRQPSDQDIAGYKAILDTTLANMMYAAITGNASGAYITRKIGVLSVQSRYRPPIFNRKFLTVLDGLVDIGWIHQTKGEPDKVGANPFTGTRYTHSDRTVIRGTKLLRKFMNTFSVHDVREIAMERAGQEVVLLKAGESSELAEYQDTPITVAHRQNLRTINAMIENANITVENRDGLRFIDERRRFQQRQFTYGSFESGARLKGGFWYDMTKAERFERIRINGEEVVELDFHGMLPHLLYAKAGLHAPVGDPYNVPGLSTESRAGIKKLFASLTFDTNLNRTRFPKKAGMHFNTSDHRKGCQAAITVILSHHKAIAHLFGKGLGHYLQFQESQVMVAVLLRLREWGYIGLPVHDCLIVPRSQASDAQNLMEQVSEDVLKIIVPVKRRDLVG